MLKSAMILLFGTFFLTSALTPVVFSGMLAVWPEMPWAFSRVYDRVAMVVVVALVYVLRKRLDVSSLREFICSRDPGFDGVLMIVGIVLCFASSLFVLPVIVHRGVFAWDQAELQGVYTKIALTVPAALLISFLEESFFRAMLFQSLKRDWSMLSAAMMSSAIYSVVHFISPVKDWKYPGFSPIVGFEYLEVVLERMLIPSIYFAFVGLFLVGMVLCYVLHATGRFYLCIGMHTGWVVAVKFSFFATDIQPGHTFDLGAGRRYFLVAEPLSWLTIGFVFFVAFLIGKWLRKPLIPNKVPA
jgi:membrane protease YdiL (CAAX protease family)